MHALRPVWLALLLTALVFAVGVEMAHAQMKMPPRSLGDVIQRAEMQGTPILLGRAVKVY